MICVKRSCSGVCSLGLHGGSPSPGVCAKCDSRIPDDTPCTHPAMPPMVARKRTPHHAEKAAPEQPRLNAEDESIVAAIVGVGDQGLGEEIKALAHAVGADRVAALWEGAFGSSCGCDARRKWLNERYPGGWRELFGLPPGANHRDQVSDGTEQDEAGADHQFILQDANGVVLGVPAVHGDFTEISGQKVPGHGGV